MFKKKTFLIIFALFLGCGTIQQSSAITIKDLGFFVPGYLAGTCPLLWPVAPVAIAGDIQDHKTTKAFFTSCGFVTGVVVFGLAVYGLKKLMTKEKAAESKENNDQLV